MTGEEFIRYLPSAMEHLADQGHPMPYAVALSPGDRRRVSEYVRPLLFEDQTVEIDGVQLIEYIGGIRVHEATFLADERERARETCHSTAGEAALVAHEAGVRMLALTHVSTRYFGHQVVEEARELFPQTVVPRDFDVVEIPFPERGSPELVRGGARASRAPVGSVES